MPIIPPKPRPLPVQTTQPKAKTSRPEPAITVAEMGRQLPAWAEEAVILYATGKIGDVTSLLNRRILDHQDERDPLPWLMLFDLYEANEQRETFDDLALDYAIRFERSPPTWTPRGTSSGLPANKSLPFAFGPQFSPIDKARLEHFLLEAADASSVSLDFSQTPAPSAAYARNILTCIDRLRSMGKAIEVIGGPAFVVRMSMASTGDRMDESGWLVLLALRSLMDDVNGFEETALAYAIRFEISPPSFAAPTALPGISASPERDPPAENVFRMEGRIGTKAAETLNNFLDFAHGRTEVELDLSRVNRVDFASTGIVLDALIKLQANNTLVVISNANLMVHALLQLIGADQFATLRPRSRK